MPETVLRYGLELRDARDELFLYHGRTDRQALNETLAKEQEYVAFSKDLATRSVILESLPAIVANADNTSAGQALKTQALYVGFLSENRALWEQLLPRCYGSWDISQLDDGRQKELLDLLAKNRAIHLALDLCARNGYSQYAQQISRELEKETEPEQRRRYCRMLAHFAESGWKLLFAQELKECSDEHVKDALALNLLPARLDEAWKYFQDRMRTGKDVYSGEVLARYGGPRDLICFQEGARCLWGDVDSLEEMGEQLKYLGCAEGFGWYWQMLLHPNGRVRCSFHGLMLSFFPEEDDTMEDGWELIGDPDEEPTASSEKLQKFWTGKIEHIRKTLDQKIRYWNGEPFDLAEVFRDVYEDGETSHWAYYAGMVEIWTGRHFPLDVYALYEKQIRQYDAILHWIESHRDLFRVGSWYRWGVELPKG